MDISNIKIENTVYNIKDKYARNNIKELIFNNIVIVGDSYTKGAGFDENASNSYAKILCQNYLKLNPENYFIFYEDAAGISSKGIHGHNFKELIEYNSSSIIDKNIIDAVFIIGGFNDINSEKNTILNDKNTLFNYISSTFPNAKIFIGMVGSSASKETWGTTDRYQLATKILDCYSNDNPYNVKYLYGVETLLKQYDCLANDRYHPNSNGHYLLAKGIYQALKYGSCQFTFQPKSLNFTPYTPFNLDVSGYTQQIGNISFLNISHINMNNSGNTFSIWQDMGIAIGDFNFLNNYPLPFLQINATIVVTTLNGNYILPGYIYLDETSNNELKIHFYADNEEIENVTFLHIKPEKLCIPTIAT